MFSPQIIVFFQAWSEENNHSKIGKSGNGFCRKMTRKNRKTTNLFFQFFFAEIVSKFFIPKFQKKVY